MERVPLLFKSPALLWLSHLLRLPMLLIIICYFFLLEVANVAIRIIEDFLVHWSVRIAFVFLGVLLAPVLLYEGHILLIWSFEILAEYLQPSQNTLLNSAAVFFLFHIALLGGLTLYAASVTIMALPFRGKKTKELISFLKRDLETEGVPPLVAVMNSFGLIALTPLVIPLTSSLPGAPGFGFFSFAYTFVILAIGTIAMIRKGANRR